MLYFQKMPYQIDVTDLNRQLAANPELWGAYGWRKDHGSGVHAGMTDIWVRYNDKRKYKQLTAEFNDEHVPVWYPAWEKLPALRSIIIGPDGLMGREEGEMLGGVLITRIPPGYRIEKHEDKGWHVGYYDKFYISLQSAPGAVFYCGDEAINPETGDCWRFDNRREHWVVNDSDQDRVTLIVCIRTEKYAKERYVFDTIG